MVEFYANGPLEVPNDLFVVSKTKRIFKNQMSNEVIRSLKTPNGYSHFNFNFLSFHNKFFHVAFIKISNDLPPYLPSIHKKLLNDSGWTV